MVVTRIFKGMDSFVFICVPLYILAGDLMNSTGLTERLVRWARTVVGKLPGRACAGPTGHHSGFWWNQRKRPGRHRRPRERSSFPTLKKKATERFCLRPYGRLSSGRSHHPSEHCHCHLCSRDEHLHRGNVCRRRHSRTSPDSGRYGDCPLPGQKAKLSTTARGYFSERTGDRDP